MVNSIETVLITGSAGQDARLLVEFLGSKKVNIVCTSSDVESTTNFYKNCDTNITFEKLDITNTDQYAFLVKKYKPTRIFNLAAKSLVVASYSNSNQFMEVNGYAVEKILKRLHSENLLGATRFYQASSSEIFDPFEKTPRNESSIKNPASPYGKSKLYSLEVCKDFRDKHGYFISSGIMFGHESEHRSEKFLFGKVTKTLARIKRGLEFNLEIGNLDAKRDWGYARDFIIAIDKITTCSIPEDYVVATGQLHSVREVIEVAYNTCEISTPLTEIILESEELIRKNDYKNLYGSSRKIEQDLEWTVTHNFESMVKKIQESALTAIGSE